MVNHEIKEKMWKCPKCGEEIEGQFSECWKCAPPESDDAKNKVTGILFKVAGVIVLIAGGLLMYGGFFSMFLNNNIDGIGIFLEVFGVGVVLAGTMLWGWERKWIVFGVILIGVGVVVPMVTISTVNMMSSIPDMAYKVSNVSKAQPAILGIAFILAGIVSIFEQRKRDRSSQ